MRKTLIFMLGVIATLHFPHALLAKNEKQRLRQLEQNIAQMKEEILRQKVTLRQLEESVLFGKITKTTAFIQFKNGAEGYFAFQDGEFFLNSKLVAKLTQKNLKNSKGLVTILDGEIPPGKHLLKIKLNYVIKKKGVFTYGKDYKFIVSSEKSFQAEEGKTQAIEIEAIDRGYFKSELKDRLVVNYNLTTGS